MNTAQRHRSLYKGTTPPWKETYRKRCVERLRSSRSRLLQRYRQAGSSSSSGAFMVQEVMEEQWRVLQAEATGRAQPWEAQALSQMFSFGGDPDELAVLEEIQQELLSEELAIIVECERNEQMEQQYLCSVVEEMQQDRTHIICPLCCRSQLSVDGVSISCKCGLDINTRQEVTADELKSLLETRLSEHTDNCSHIPVFSLAPNRDVSATLIISCQTCDYLSVVL